VTLGALLGKFSFKESLAIGFAMNARGAMEIVLASVALEHKLIDERIFVALFIMAVGTSMLSAPLIKRFLKGSGYVLN
jgi:Kef-type K+ transport system membrane component KefB